MRRRFCRQAISRGWNPSAFSKYNGQVLFDPAYQENRDFICKVVDDIVNRYDVDAIHIDDYFYPYPAHGKKYLMAPAI